VIFATGVKSKSLTKIINIISFSYNYYNKEDGEIWQSIQKLDLEGAGIIEKHDIKEWKSYLKTKKNTICGRVPISIVLHVNLSDFQYFQGNS